MVKLSQVSARSDIVFLKPKFKMSPFIFANGCDVGCLGMFLIHAGKKQQQPINHTHKQGFKG